MSPQIFIQLDRPNAAYRPGEVLRGAAVVVTRAVLKPRAIALRIIGDEVTTLGPNVLMTEHTHPYDLNYPLWSASIEQDELPPGEHSLPFTLALPPGLPPTFNGELTKIAYRVEVKINRALHPDIHADLPVHIRVPLIEDADQPVRASASLPNGARVEVHLPCSGYLPGDHVLGQLTVLGLTQPLKSATVDLLSREKGEAREFVDHVEHVRVRAEIDPGQLSGGQPFPIDLPIPADADPSFVAQHSSKTRLVRAHLTLSDGHTLTAEAVIRVGQHD